MNFKFFTITFLLLFILIELNAQNIERWIDSNEKVPVEKIYLHLDAEYYFQNDTIWFKVYLMDSRSGQLIPGAENVYVSLLDKNSNSVFESILLCNKGETSGNIAITGLIKPGNYLLQAHTDYLMNFTHNAWFQKLLSISESPTSSKSVGKQNSTPEKLEDIFFFPEGGFLLEEITNLIAFKATNSAGFGINASGTIEDEQGNTITTFKTDFKGMGLFFLTPESGKTYSARVNELPSFHYIFEPEKENIKLQLVNHTSKEVILNIVENSGKYLNQIFYLVNMYRGEVLFYQPFKMETLNQVLKYDSQILKPGINRLVLLSNELKPISERLLFSRNTEINRLQIFTDRETYSTRSKVKLTIKNSEETMLDEISHLSVSVINKTAFRESGKSQNILSHLLIDSELNSFFEPSAEFFTDTKINSDAKLKLLMLTNGWSSYLWNSMPCKTEVLQFAQSAGIDLKGIATNNLSEKPIKNGEITLVIQKDGEVAFLTKKTNDLGEFVFPGLLFSDTATIHIQAKNEKNRRNSKIIVLPTFKKTEVVENSLKVLTQNIAAPVQLQNIKHRNYNNNEKDESEIARNRDIEKEDTNTKNDEYFRLYESADYVINIQGNDESFDNIIDFLAGKVPGVDINGDEIRIRGTNNFGTSSSPLFLVDGVPLNSNINFNLPTNIELDKRGVDNISNSDQRLVQSVKAIPLNDVDKIEILKSPQNLAVFGTTGANGVIAIFTRSGQNETSNKTAKGIIKKQIVGYASQKIFYSPKYNSHNNKKSNVDFRTTLFWNPKVITKNGISEVSFLTSDISGPQIIIIEGVTNKGKICLSEAVIEILD